ncbi:AAA family ATPase [Filimonas effusa]|uniref:Rad50/SbcC-type AAA domain-containing protein n=1 Tax=Filimonas effusa TaxID=2508721 RepID=A0A4Q1DDJ0_9BACT|nr:AAA family ATPase [Filimonas effusa]RXK87038.1 hypothetical protein ESB13_09710 [Filimonas effusa]
MRILGIRIKNLASLDGFTEINFTREPLSSAGIFAITGPTGAGKSTILDALCLALYGKTPRYKQGQEAGVDIIDVQGSTINQGDHRGILRDGAGEGFAEVDFIGTDAQTYTATWKVRRARDKADGALQPDTTLLTNKLSGAIFPGKKKETAEEIERLVGLNFEQFTRSVLLAQGDFTAFLKAAKDEKSALLEKLTGTRIYSEISRQIFAHYSQEKRALEDLNLQREGIVTLTAEELQELERQKTTMEQSMALLEKEAETLNQEINWHDRLKLLQTTLSAASAAQEQAMLARQNAASREQLLKLVEQVQPTRSWMEGQQAAEKQLSEKATALQQLHATLHHLQQQQEALSQQLQTANEAAAATIGQQEEALPHLEEAKALDVQIKEKALQVAQVTTEVKTVEETQRQLERQLQIHQQQAEKLHFSITQLQQWKQDNAARQPIAENHGLINAKLADAQVLLDAAQELLPQLEIVQTAITGAQHAKAELEIQLATITQQIQAERPKHTAAAEALAGIPIADVEKGKAAIDTHIEDIIGAEAHWKIISHSQAELDILTQKLAGNKDELQAKVHLLACASEQLLVAAAERDASLRMLEKAKLAAAENVELLRSQLTAEEPCPVCGSKEHPYVTEQPQLNHVLSELKAAHEQHDKAYTTCLQAESGLKQTVNNLEETIDLQEQEVGTKETSLAVQHTTWLAFTIYPQADTISDQQKATWLAQQLQDARAQQKHLQQQIQLHANQKQELNALQQHIHQLEQQHNQNSNALKDTERQLQSLQQQQAQQLARQQDSHQALAVIEESLAPYFVTTGWFTNWQQDAALFLQRISQFADQWKTTTQKLEEDTRQQDILTAKIEAAKNQLQNASADVQKKQAALGGVTQQQEVLTQKRQAIFNGEAAATIEQKLKQAVTAALQAVDKMKADRELLQTSLTRTATQKEQAEKDILLLQQQAEALVQNIQQWLATFNSGNASVLTHQQLGQLLAYDTRWIATERAALRVVENALNAAQSVWQERNTQLQQHQQQRLSERNAEELVTLLNTAKANLQQQVQQKNEIGFQLQLNSSNKQKIGQLLNAIQAQALTAENWAKLNELIGSADGKKFRLIAQEYTLDALLTYANVHLAMLSNRYLLQRIPSTLGLQVVDQYMGNEVRTVYSLSGGESFLASLALALGLASLSGSQMQVESLFIDEGFGSLDPATLNIAMDALERLHDQGRKVGVISHVQEMTERIPIQIKVNKQQSGRSKVEVVNV